MCTVTFVPVQDGILLTSNRDEWHTRGVAIAPEKYTGHNRQLLLYPRDKDKGGSWIIAKNNGDAGVLLNGAFQPHLRKKVYRKSRGLVLLEIMNADIPFKKWNEINLEGIEPFTVILYARDQLNECRWDGDKKYTTLLSTTAAYIWSSVTLYDENMMKQRNKWFHDWQNALPNPYPTDVIQFHKSAGADDPGCSLVMDRPGKIATVSITSIHLSEKKAEMTHFDIKNRQQHLIATTLSKAIPPVTKKANDARLSGIKRGWIRFCHWEYWPFNLVYIPAYIYWIWLSIRARSFFFFSAANPLIKNAGFLMESKKEIYDLMPENYYPTTILCKPGIAMKEITTALAKANLVYPVIAKPDIGQRGMQVKLLQSENELHDYLACARFNFLIQEFISYKNEIGIFYYRMPQEKTGHISGIVGKEFLTVTGDGHSTIEQLLTKDNRHFLQLPVLKETKGKLLKTILPVNEQCELVPYGNHSRGAKFIDLTKLLTPKLLESIDQICKSIPEFYYGRLDIKFSNWDDLCKGINFSIIELNGAGSEPTHIYDPQHSVFFAWKEIIRHHRILYNISQRNAKLKGIKLMSTRNGLLMLRENRKYLKILERLQNR